MPTIVTATSARPILIDSVSPVRGGVCRKPEEHAVERRRRRERRPIGMRDHVAAIDEHRILERQADGLTGQRRRGIVGPALDAAHARRRAARRDAHAIARRDRSGDDVADRDALVVAEPVDVGDVEAQRAIGQRRGRMQRNEHVDQRRARCTTPCAPSG